MKMPLLAHLACLTLRKRMLVISPLTWTAIKKVISQWLIVTNCYLIINNNYHHQSNGQKVMHATHDAQRLIDSVDAELILYMQEQSVSLQEYDGKFTCPRVWWSINQQSTSCYQRFPCGFYAYLPLQPHQNGYFLLQVSQVPRIGAGQPRKQQMI